MSLHGTIDERQVAEDRESVASDLLIILHRCECELCRKTRLIPCLASLSNRLPPTVLVWSIKYAL